MKRRILTIVLIALSFVAYAQKKVACVGDSVTYGMTIQDREQNCYPAQLQGLLGDGYEVRNFGRNGATLLSRGHRPYVKTEEYAAAIDFAPDYVVIHLGLNDTDPRDWPDWSEDFIPDYRALIDSFRKANPAVRVWICRMTPILHGHHRFQSGTRVWYEAVQKTIEQVAAYSNVGLIDLEAPLFVRPDLLAADNLHPSAEGAAIIAKTVYGALTGDYGGLWLPAYYSDNMVLQRDRENVISGTADAGTEVAVALKAKGSAVKASGMAGPDGRWTVTLPPMPAGGPYTLKIGDRKFSNVWIGEVWICAGQSNMEFMLKQCDTAAEDMAAAADGRLHLYNMVAKYRTDNVEWPLEALAEINRLEHFVPTSWTVSSPETAASFSAIGYHFAKALADRLGCHVGVVNCAVGGSTTESWCAPEVLRREHPQVLEDWYHNDFGQEWARGRALKNIARAENVKFQRHPYQPGYLFDSALRPFKGFSVKGILWYQGESNAHCFETHEEFFRYAVESWRSLFGDSLPVETIQLSGIATRPSWPSFRNSQRLLAEEIDGVGMTVCSDLGHPTDVHPKSKKPVGERAAKAALHDVYGFDIVPSGPVYRGFSVEGASLRLRFDYADGLKCSAGFEVAGGDGIYHPASVVVDGPTLLVSSPDVPEPCAVRYAWTPDPAPEKADLVNSSGMPCSTFRDSR